MLAYDIIMSKCVITISGYGIVMTICDIIMSGIKIELSGHANIILRIDKII